MRATTHTVMAAIGGLLGGWLRGPEQHERECLLSLGTVSSIVRGETVGKP